MRRMIPTKKINILDRMSIQSDGNINVSGKLTGDEIVENMSGYSFNKGTEIEGLTREFIYAGVVKNGNKLTLVIACNLTRTATIPSGPTLGSFTLPAEVLNRIYPSTIGTYDYISVGTINVWVSDSVSKEIQIYSTKGSNGINTGMNRTPLNALTEDTKYYARWELTLLLSDNLIDQ